MNKIEKQEFQIGDIAYLIDDDYNYFEATVTDISLITYGKKSGTIEYIADEYDFTKKKILIIGFLNLNKIEILI